MNECDFLASYDPTAFDRPSLTVDLVLMSVVAGRPAVLLMQRREHPFAGHWALPGSFVGMEESLDAAAARVLHDKAHLDGAWLEQLYTFGAPGRDPRMRIVTTAYFALLPAARFTEAVRADPQLTLAAVDVPWPGETGGPVQALDGEGTALPLAFDHGEILSLAMLRLRGKLDWSAIAFALLPGRFTLRELQDVHEAILGTPLNKPAFRRRMLDKGWLQPTGTRTAGSASRPAELFRFMPQDSKGEC